MDYLKRQFEDIFQDRFKMGFIMAILGARQVGKTTFLKKFQENLLKKEKIPEKNIFYFSLDDLVLRRAISKDFYFLQKEIEKTIGTLLKDYKKTIYLLIDEAQKAPDIFDLLKIFYDQWRKRIRIVISGSSVLEIQKKSAESLAGRINYIYLSPLSIREVIDNKLTPLPSACLFEKFSERLKINDFKKHQSLVYQTDYQFDSLMEKFLLEGGLPATWTEEDREKRRVYLSSFIDTYLDKEIRSLSQVGNIESFLNMLEAFSYQTGSLLNISKLSSDLGMAVNTIKSYKSILLSSFILNQLRPFSIKRRVRFAKSPKIYFFDVGIANLLAKRENFSHLYSSKMLGAAFENIIIKSFETFSKNCLSKPRLSFWRDYEDHEIDLIIENSFNILPVEISYTDNISNKKIRNFKHFFKNFPKAEQGLLVYKGGLKKIMVGKREIFCLPWWLWW